MFNKIKNTITNLNPIIQMQDILYSPMLCSDVIERKIEYDGKNYEIKIVPLGQITNMNEMFNFLGRQFKIA